MFVFLVYAVLELHFEKTCHLGVWLSLLKTSLKHLQITHFSASCNHKGPASVLFRVQLSCSSPFTRLFIRIDFNVLSLFLSSTFETMEIFQWFSNDFCSFNLNTAKQRAGTTKFRHIFGIKTFWNSQLVSMWKNDVFSFNEKLY